MFFYAVSFLAIFLLLFHIDILNFISNVTSSLSMCKHVALVALLALTYFARFQIKIIIKSLIWPQIASLEKLIIYFRLELIKINQSTLFEAISDTERCVWIVSSWSRHQSSSLSVSSAHWVTSSGSEILWSGGRLATGRWWLSFGDKLAIAMRFARTLRKLAKICANGVTIKSSPCLKIYSFNHFFLVFEE